MSDLTDFLLARIAEDEQQADAPRARAECEAKRRIVEGYRKARDEARGWRNVASNSREVAFWDVMRTLALPYADHPDFCEEGWM